ncbi:nucleotide sugar dehydrogenase [Akkermansiaceae bacterium]|nr:nucleotide sugar dehydrogenase [Akkermansiaceae bacterium]MDA7871129.1 nucleotide sugar dehydrogenase [Akkermansiaceae bacterium]MDA7875354.1 nucleotide sugar dehydrogenase [Akkermansiaceae bacterium]MDC0301397.1 nucleotide sugar dehydrogenase [Akkermansiaceae bacterium]
MKIAIIGLGYVGLPLGLRFAESNVSVLGLDVDQQKVDAINAGETYIRHIEAEKIDSARDSSLLEASTNFSRIVEVDAIIICVPTPLNQYREPDISYVLKSGEAIAPYLAQQDDGGFMTADSGDHESAIKNQQSEPKLVVLESTTYPGTTDTDLRKVLEAGSGLKAGEGFHLAYSPEREDPGRKDHSVKTIPKVMGGYSEACLQRCVELYSMALDAVHPVNSCRVAEATKLTENIFRSVNIALVNELKVVFKHMDIDVWDVIDAAATKPFGYMPFYPGPGLGGHCIPIDPFYLTWKAREYEQHTRFIELAGEINTQMPDYVVGRVSDALNDEGKSVKGSNILLLGIAYKPNVEDDRESPSYVLMEKLEAKGARVSYNDPYVDVLKVNREFPEYAGRASVEISDKYDCILIATHHNEYITYDFSGFKAPLVDSRCCVTMRPLKYYHA